MALALIPPRQEVPDDKDRRFYVSAPTSIYLKLQQEAVQRGTDLWTLGGAVLTAWLLSGCPGTFDAPQSPLPSSSPVADDQGGDE